MDLESEINFKQQQQKTICNSEKLSIQRYIFDGKYESSVK